ncbi:hypothetical protein LCM28_09885 [Salipiger pacificus]|nr:hypothetical protein [Alloyangia pacifica]
MSDEMLSCLKDYILTSRRMMEAYRLLPPDSIRAKKLEAGLAEAGATIREVADDLGITHEQLDAMMDASGRRPC